MDVHAVPAGILYQYTSFYQLYGPIINDIDTIVDQQGGIRPDFWYDWRVDLEKSADVLAQAIAKACSGPNPADQVSIVAHSMGGLVSRLLLESGKYNAQPWFRNIIRFVAVCVPHVGAPISLARALGLEGSTFISADDMKRCINDEDFPAGFELFPAPAYRTAALFDVKTGPRDIYDPGTATKFGLSAQNQAAALASWSKLDFSKKPKGVPYIAIVGTGLQTENAYSYDNTSYRSTSSVDGDGTVPSWSASHGTFDKLYTMPGDHIGVMNTNQFRQTLYEIFNLTMTSIAMTELAGKPNVSVSLQRRNLKPGQSMQALLIPDHPATEISGKLVIRKAGLATDGTNASLASIGADVPVSYTGPRVASVPVTIRAPETPGAYVLSFEGTHLSTTETSAAFVVTP